MIGVRNLEGGKSEVVLKDEPSYCHALTAVKAQDEIGLQQGLWLVLWFAVWSVPDRIAVDYALSAVKTFDGLVNLGIHAFDEYGEINEWHSDVQSTYSSPVWLIMVDGIIVSEFLYIRSTKRLTEILKPVINQYTANKASNDVTTF